MRITLSLDDAEVRRGIRRASVDAELGRVMAKALNRTAFEVRDAEAREVDAAFEFAGPGTRKFLAGKRAFFIGFARPEQLEATIQPKRGTERILDDHVFGSTIRASDRERLAFGDRLAVPIKARRGRRGKVSARDLVFDPATGELKPDSGAFVVGDAILRRKRRRGRGTQVEVLFALVDSASLRRTVDFDGVARVTADREFTGKAREEFQRMRFSV